MLYQLYFAAMYIDVGGNRPFLEKVPFAFVRYVVIFQMYEFTKMNETRNSIIYLKLHLILLLLERIVTLFKLLPLHLLEW